MCDPVLSKIPFMKKKSKAPAETEKDDDVPDVDVFVAGSGTVIEIESLTQYHRVQGMPVLGRYNMS